MSKSKRFAKTLKSVMNSKDSIEILSTPEFMQYLQKQSDKMDVDPLKFFMKPKKFMRKLKPKH